MSHVAIVREAPGVLSEGNIGSKKTSSEDAHIPRINKMPSIKGVVYIVPSSS